MVKILSKSKSQNLLKLKFENLSIFKNYIKFILLILQKNRNF